MKSLERRNWVSIFIKFVLATGLIGLFLFALLHSHFIQERITKFAISSIIDKSKGRATVQKATFDIYEGIQLSGLILTAEEGDTLLTVDNFSVSPKNTLLSFIRGNINLHDLNMAGASVFLKRKQNEELYNWQKFLNSFKKSDGGGSGSAESDSPIELTRLELSDIDFSMVDEHTGLRIGALFDKFEIEIDGVSIGDSSVISLKRWVLTNPQVDIYQYKSVEKEDSVTINGDEAPISFPKLYVDNLDIINGLFTMTTEEQDEITFDEFSDIDLLARAFVFEDPDDWSIILDDVSAKTPSGYAQHASIKSVTRKSGNLIAKGATLRTENSLVRFDLNIQNYQDWSGFDDAIVNVNMEPSILRMNEFYPFFPLLKKEFESQVIASEPIQIQGIYEISSNQITGKDVKLWIGDKHYFSGLVNLEMRTQFDQSRIELEILDFKSDVRDFTNIYEKVNIPEELTRLGNIQFQGIFTGKLTDFVASGHMTSDLGKTQMNVQIQREMGIGGQDSITYAGLLELDSFNLSGLLLNPDFGYVDATLNIRNGKGIDLVNSDANLEALVHRFEYKGFAYKDAIYEGRLTSKIIDGTFKITDSDLDFYFDGLVDLSRETPVYDFEIQAETIDFCKLNLTEFPCQLSFLSDVNFRGKNFRTAQGESSLNTIVLKHDTSELRIDNILVTSREIASGMAFFIQSDYLDADIRGEFNLLKLYQAIYRQLLTNHADQNEVLGLSDEMGDIPDQNFTYDIKLKNATPLFSFLGIDMDMSGVTTVQGAYKTVDGLVNVVINSPVVIYDNVKAESLELTIDSRQDAGVIKLRVEDLGRDNINLYDFTFESNIDQDLIRWKTSFFQNEANQISISSESRAQSSGYFTEIKDHRLIIDSAEWQILPNPGFGIYKDKLDINSLVATDGSRSISVKDIDQTGIELSLNDFNFEYINPLINYDKLYFTGYADSKLRIENIFDEKSIQGYLEVAELAINGDDYGSLLLRANQGDTDIIDLDLSITKDSQNLYTRGYMDTRKEYVNVDLTLEDYPMNFFEYIITDGISETEGTTDIDAKIYGTFDDMKLSGLANIKNGGVKVDYLGTFYRMYDQQVKIDENFVDLNGVRLIDARENEAVISGGLRHNFLGDFRTDLTISSPEFITLSTTNLDNPLYYGLGNGEIEVIFDGPFDAVNMKVNATTGPLTQLFIPINSTQYGYDESFIKFDYEEIEKDSATLDALVNRLQESGVDFEMNLTFTPDADVSVIYDESTSNILYGKGRGNLRILVKRDGEFSVYGNYDIEEGEYRYTAYGFIAKPFVINRGGKVSWTGDPINANLEVTADYAGLRAPLNVFLQEYIASSTLQPREFSQRREVDLTLLLSGTLFDPTIDFDIDFPNLTGELKTLADSKVRALSSTENGINNQVVGLLVFRNFLPDNNPFASIEGSTLGQSGNNTITEFLTSQLSLLFSDYLSEKLAGNGFIEGIDFEIAVAQNTSVLESSNQEFIAGLVDFVPDEVQLNLRNRFKNDNFVLSIGGNYVRQSEFETASDYLTGDFALDWFISDDKRLKLRFYGNYDYDEAFAERKQKYGFGINYRREFGSITKFQNVLDGLIEDINKATSPPTTSKR